jgi:hypothetical protein
MSTSRDQISDNASTLTVISVLIISLSSSSVNALTLFLATASAFHFLVACSSRGLNTFARMLSGIGLSLSVVYLVAAVFFSEMWGRLFLNLTPEEGELGIPEIWGEVWFLVLIGLSTCAFIIVQRLADSIRSSPYAEEWIFTVFFLALVVLLTLIDLFVHFLD